MSALKADRYFIEQMRAQARWRLEESVNLLPSENMTSPQVRALLSSDFGHRYSLPLNEDSAGWFIENAYRGTHITNEVELQAEKLAREVFSSDHACVQPLSGHIAAMIAIASTAGKRDSLCAIAAEHGGYDGYGQKYIPDILGMRYWPLPFDKRRQNVAVEKAVAGIRAKKPRLVILGASYIPFPYEMAPIREACDEVGADLIYDASHVLGLVAGGEFQEPLSEGADILYGSTHKSFYGPQGGIITTDRDDLDANVRKNLTWRFVDNIHWNRVAALGQALLESKRFGKAYAKQVVKNARRLGKELTERGFPLLFEDQGYTSSHQLMIDQKGLADKFDMDPNEFSVVLERSNIIVDSVARLGTAELTRLGVKEKDIPELAEMFMDALGGRNVKKRVREYRDRYDIAYAFK
ncbi:MAG TPA: serine hydroxymethyltransferase [Thermoplasmata archaeon]|nr:serine hydroxymethyltransferase [Thermoplasmata archaeon]